MLRRPNLADTPIAILAGGPATHLHSQPVALPPSMIEVAGRPFIDHQLGLLRAHGIRRVVLCLGHLGEQVQAYVGSGARWGLYVRCVFEGAVFRGTGGALRRALPWLGDVCWVTYADCYLPVDFNQIYREFIRAGKPALVTVHRNHPVLDGRFGDDKPAAESIRRNDGLTLLERRLIERIPADAPSDLADLVSTLLAENLMTRFEVSEPPFEIASPSGLQETSEFLTRRAA